MGVSQALLDNFVRDVLPKFKNGPIILVTSDYNSDRYVCHQLNMTIKHIDSHFACQVGSETI